MSTTGCPAVSGNEKNFGLQSRVPPCTRVAVNDVLLSPRPHVMWPSCRRDLRLTSVLGSEGEIPEGLPPHCITAQRCTKRLDDTVAAPLALASGVEYQSPCTNNDSDHTPCTNNDSDHDTYNHAILFSFFLRHLKHIYI
jgi:hypothetical protein